MDESAKSWQVLQERCLAAPGCVRQMPMEELKRIAPLLEAASATVVTGLGASEGPARLLASGLSVRDGHPARFIPLSGLIAGDHEEWTTGNAAAVLVVFSQALSPNARIALEIGREFSSTILVCGSDVVVDDAIRTAPDMNLFVIHHPPENESGFLLRVTGPAVASAIALGLAALATGEDTPVGIEDQWRQCAEAMELRLHTRPPTMNLLAQPPAFLVYGTDGVERNFLLRWTLLECFDNYDPPTWDMMSFAHGAFQNTFNNPRTLILLRSLEDRVVKPLVDRVRDMLSQTPHSLIDVSSELPRPWCTMEHLAAVQSFMLEHLRQNPRDLANWPGRGLDGAIYMLDQIP
ncbi:MAG TPA: hypothetical protein PK156_09550 [Polyangium sp.]|nr:hypothetical protein [Polyangium sp.]